MVGLREKELMSLETTNFPIEATGQSMNHHNGKGRHGNLIHARYLT